MASNQLLTITVATEPTQPGQFVIKPSHTQVTASKGEIKCPNL